MPHTHVGCCATTQRAPVVGASARRRVHEPGTSLRRITHNTSDLSCSALADRSSWREPILISGGGIAGLAVAVALTKVGLPVHVFEAAPGLRAEGTAVSLWGNAWRALDALGVAAGLRSTYLPLKRVELCSDRGQLLRGFPLAECVGAAGGKPEVRGVMRPVLLEALYDSLPDAGRVVSFGSAVQEVLVPEGPAGSGGRGGSGDVAVRLSDGRTVYGSMLIGADGVGSVVARYLQLPRPRYSGYVAYRGVVHNTPHPQDQPLPATDAAPDADVTARHGPPGDLPLDTIRQVWGAGVRAGLYPLTPTCFYWYVCFNAGEEAASHPPPTPEARQREALAAVRGWSWGLEEAIRQTDPSDIYWSRISDRWTPGSFGRGVVSAAGDAAHPMTPNLGQGAGTALEDAVVLGRRLGQMAAEGAAGAGGPPSPAARATCLRAYETERSARCLPLTVRSNLMGAALQIPLAPVTAVRNLFVQTVFQPSHFLDHAAFDCGSLHV